MFKDVGQTRLDSLIIKANTAGKRFDVTADTAGNRLHPDLTA